MGDVNLGMGGQYHEASGLVTLQRGGGLVEMARPCERHFWALQGLGAPVAEDMENMPGKLLRARVASGAAGKIRHNRSKIENFIEVKSNTAAELSRTAGAQPAAHRDTKKGAGVSIGYSTVGEWVVLTQGGTGKKAKPQALVSPLPPWLVKDRPDRRQSRNVMRAN